ncbi:response regulator [Brevibacillus sp. NRS-1366]|uniref:response regulator n=1 Tax=Brevibacillus sp. NRS-1366 TaxID=3233899 RepID=UPI003D25874A
MVPTCRGHFSFLSPSILIVDDEPQILEILSSYLQKEGYHVLTASEGREALEIAEAYPLSPDDSRPNAA